MGIIIRESGRAIKKMEKESKSTAIKKDI